MLSLANLVSMSFVLALLAPLGLYMWTGDGYYAWLAAAIVAANVVVAALKPLFARWGAAWTRRPAGATDCDALCMQGAAGGAPGFPSGHMTSVVMAVVGIWLRTGDQNVLTVGVPWIAAMAWARWAKHCHTWPQILGGSAFGAACAAGLHGLQ